MISTLHPRISSEAVVAQIIVDTVVLANYERYSSSIKDFLILGSQRYPTNEWVLLGNFTAEDVRTTSHLRFDSNFLISDCICVRADIRRTNVQCLCKSMDAVH